MSYEVIERNGTLYAEILWANARTTTTRFYSRAESSFQFGLLAHAAGYQEPPHTHKPVTRTIKDLQQMFVVQRGRVGVRFFDEQGLMFREVVLGPGDAISLVHGAHAVRVIEDMQCVSVKQGPFFGDEMDKVEFDAKP